MNEINMLSGHGFIGCYQVMVHDSWIIEIELGPVYVSICKFYVHFVLLVMKKYYNGLFIGPTNGTLGAKSRSARRTSFMLRPPWLQVARSLDGRPPTSSPRSPTVPMIDLSTSFWSYSVSINNSIRSITSWVVVGLARLTNPFSLSQK